MQLQPGKAPWRRPQPALQAADPTGRGEETWLQGSGKLDGVDTGLPGCFQ